jgi:hypothetical protein
LTERILIFLKSSAIFFNSLPAPGRCVIRDLFLKRDAPIKPNCRETRGLSLGSKRLTHSAAPKGKEALLRVNPEPLA